MASIDAYKRQLLDSNSSTSSQYSLVKRVAYHLSSRLPSNIAIEDLVQAGMEGLLQAQKVFDASRGINFELFAKTRIRGAMLDEVRRISFSTRNVISTKRKQDDIIRDLTQKLGRQPKNIEVAASWASLLRNTRAIGCSRAAQSSLARMNLQKLLKKLMKTEEAPKRNWSKRKILPQLLALASAKEIEKLPER